MNALITRFDSWLSSGPFTTRDFALYRIIYSAFGLITLKQSAWLADVPDALFDPPPGPFQLASGFPSLPILVTIDVLLALFMASLLLGFLTRASSIAVALLLMVVEGFSYSTGKIDHSILFTVVPAVMAFSRWGNQLSIDGMLNRTRDDAPVRQWLLRLLGFCVGAAMLTAGLPKLYNGWLNPNSQASFGYQAVEYYANGRHAGLAGFFVGLNAPWYWETLDWLTVIIECAIIFAAFFWRVLRLAIALLTVFHLGVLLSLNIAFSQNIVVYAAFVSWVLIIPSRRNPPAATSERASPLTAVLAIISVLVLGLGMWAIASYFGPARLTWVSPATVVIGAMFGISYLAYQAWKIFRRQPAKYGG